MTNYSLIAVGINRYQLIQPLNFARDDARAIWKFAVEEAEMPDERALLLADTSASVENQSTAPTQDNILSWLQAEESDDNWVPWLWFFFSGYGVSWEGTDYLLPLDGNLADIPNTGISLRSLLDILQRKQARNILVLLDMNRSPGLIAANDVGSETVELAKERGINLILSSQLQQMSHESSDLGQGFFTAALLEALRYYHSDLTLEKLETYLSDRLPELCEHHWRPPQRPLFLIPFPEAREQLVLPGSAAAREEQYAFANALTEADTPQIETNGKASSAQIATSAPIVRPNSPLLSSTAKPPEETPDAPNLLSQIEETSRQKSLPNVQKWLALGGGLFLLCVLAGVFLNRDGEPQLTESAPVEGEPSAENSAAPTEDPPATAVKPILPPPNSSPQQGAPSPAATAPSPAPAASPAPIPAPSPATVPAPAPAANRLLTQEEVMANVYLRNVQASKFGQAIADARKVPSDAPSYEEAQRSITRWSLAILDIARGRANQGNFGGAIAAANLIAPDQGEVRQLAQQKIQTWQGQAQQQQQNQGKIAKAKQAVRPNSASSYNQAISTLRTIPLGQPGYAEAKKLKETWGEQIYKIANSRAAAGQFQNAIATANLVPGDTPSHAAAQQAIARWQKGQR
ncbi:MAG: caspase family protein [Cyanobacteriota bacterium]|nr:caspase family protein [Cyanobacteriota bacterium]